MFKDYLTRIILIGFPDIRKPQGGGPGINTSLKLIFMSDNNDVMPWKCHFLNHHFTVFLVYLHFKVIIFLFLYIILKFIFPFLENLFWLHCKDFFTALCFLLEKNCPHLIRHNLLKRTFTLIIMIFKRFYDLCLWAGEAFNQEILVKTFN